MTIPKDIPQPTQPDVQTPGRRDRPRRPRRVLPAYPDSPVVIPSERAEAGRESLRMVHELWGQGRHLDSLLKWFELPKDKREDAINGVILQEVQRSDRSLRSAQQETEGKPANLILQHYALFSTDTVGKIIKPDHSEPITNEDATDLVRNPGSGDEFRFRLRILGLRDPSSYDMDDFILPRDDMQRNFSLEEARRLLVTLIPQLSDDVKRNFLPSYGLVHIIKYADLLTDPRLADALEKSLLKEHPWSHYIENYISQYMFPSAEFFEEAFKRLDPKDSDPNANFHISVKSDNDTEVPASVFYFTMLRKITLLKSFRERHPEFGKGLEEKTISYLLNDAFMEHTLPYLETENAYGDDFIYSLSGSIGHNAEVEATGDEAKALKRKRLGEVINTAIEYARQKGDEQTVKRLTEREVGGVKFADFITQ